MIPLWAHQQEAIDRARGRDSFALFFEQGTGKSRTTLEILREHFAREGRVLNTLILAPPIVCPNWLNEFKKYTQVDERKVCVLLGPGPRRVKELERMRKLHPTGFVVVTNYEGLVAVRGLLPAIEAWRPEVLVLDESQRIKSQTSLRAKAAHKLAKGARFRYLLSGTPVLNSPMDLWSQYLAMDLGASFGTNFWTFRAKFFVDKNAFMPKGSHFPNFVLRPGAIEAFQELISCSSTVVKKADCLDLPPLVRQVVEVELSPKQAKHYNEMKEEFVTYMNSEACVAQLAITKALRLQQIVSGHLAMDDGTVADFGDTPRVVALKEQLELIMEDPTHKCLVWASWRHDYNVIRRVCDELKIRYVEVHGEVSSRDKSTAVHDFCNDPNVRVFLGHPGSGGVGINLVEASYMIYYSRSFNLEHDLQSEARNYRAGSEMHTSVTRIDLVATRTIDQEIQKALVNKIAIGDSLLRTIKSVL